MNGSVIKLKKIGVVAVTAALCISCASPAGAKPGNGGWIPELWRKFTKEGPSGQGLPDFGRAGYDMGRSAIPARSGPVFDVTAPRFGALPDDGKDDTVQIQKAIEAAGATGGGVVYLPRGQYEIRTRPDSPYLRIMDDNVVVRGEGDDEKGTVLHLCNKGPEETVRRLGSVPALKEPRSCAALAVYGGEQRGLLASYTGDVKRGALEIPVDSTAGLKAGQPVIVEFTDPAIDVEKPAPEKADLVRQLTAPFALTADQVDTFGKEARHLTWNTRIEKILGPHAIRLSKPARFDQLLRYQPRIYSFPGVHEVGIEQLRITSEWQGGYRHHKPFADAQGKVVRTAREQDYLWVGIWSSFAIDSWIRNVTFVNLTQGVIVSQSTDMTIANLTFRGLDGHAGVTIGRSNDILVTHADFFGRFVHPFTFEMMASGNVVSDAAIHYAGRNDVNATDAVMDFHGLFPFENLYDNLHGFYICPGGDMSVLPHAGVRNVFWNIEAPEAMSCYVSDPNEFARTWAYTGTSSKSPATMFEHFPQSYYVGIHRQGKTVTIGGSDRDRQDQWMTVEGVNRADIALPSLYQAQHEFHEKKK